MSTLKDKTAKGLFWGAMSNGSMQILNVVFGIFLARLLSQSDYGLVAMLAIFTAIASAIQESGFTSALVNMEKPTNNDYNSVFWFSTLMGITLYVLLFFCAPLIADFYHQPILTTLSRVAFLTIPLSAIGIVPQAYLFRNLQVKETTVIRILALVVSGVAGIIMAFRGKAYWSLVCQQILYVSITSLGKFFYTPWRPSLHIDFGPVRRMFGFSCKIMFTSIVNTVSNNILTVIFGRLFKPMTVGNFNQAYKWNNTAFSLVSGTVAQVAQPVFSSISDDTGRLVNVFRKMMRFTAFLAFPVMFGLCIISEEFITLAIGEKWHDSIILLQILCISGAFMPMQSTYQNLIVSRGRSDVYMWVNIGLIVLSTILIIVLSSYGIVTMVTAYAALNIVWIAVWQHFARRIIGLRHRDTLRDILPFLLASIAVMALTYFVTSFIDNMVMRLVVKIIMAALLYFLVMKCAHAHIMDECMGYIIKKRSPQSSSEGEGEEKE